MKSESSSSSSLELLNSAEFSCSFCGRPGHNVEKCWTKYPELRPKGAGSRGRGRTRSGSRGNHRNGSRGNFGQPSANALFFLEDSPKLVISPPLTAATKVSAKPSEVLSVTTSVAAPSIAESSNFSIRSSERVIIDSGCSRHVIGALFAKYIIKQSEVAPLTLRLPDGRIYESRTEVTISVSLQTRTGVKQLKLCNVVFIKPVTQFLISVSQLCRYGYGVTFSSSSCTMITPNGVEVEFPRDKADSLY